MPPSCCFFIGMPLVYTFNEEVKVEKYDEDSEGEEGGLDEGPGSLAVVQEERGDAVERFPEVVSSEVVEPGVEAEEEGEVVGPNADPLFIGFDPSSVVSVISGGSGSSEDEGAESQTSTRPPGPTFDEAVLGKSCSCVCVYFIMKKCLIYIGVL